MGKRREQRTNRVREPDIGEGNRAARLRQLIREEVNFLLRSEIRDPRLRDVEITMVELAGDRARLWFTADDRDDKIEALDGAAGYLRGELAAALGLKRTPELRFRRDPATRAYAREELVRGDC
jgi:ribosome-binding factor A